MEDGEVERSGGGKGDRVKKAEDRGMAEEGAR